MTRVAVIGVGSMGRNHARVYRDMPDVQLVAVADQDKVMATQVGRLYGVTPYTDYVEMLDRENPEAVTVAVPTSSHFRVAKDALESGCHVLLEKPITATLDEARTLVSLPAARDRVVMVGHVERFNPAVIELKRKLDNGDLGRIFQVEARRVGPFPPRIRDVGVIIDLATHDLDIMRYLTGSEAKRVYAETNRQMHVSSEDLFTGLIRFHNDTLGVLDINWLTPTKIRELTATGEHGMFRVDYLTQDLYFFENADASRIPWDALSVVRGVSEGTMTRFAIAKKEPLRAELETFISAIHGQRVSIASAVDGMKALALAQSLIKSGAEHRPIELHGHAAAG